MTALFVRLGLTFFIFWFVTLVVHRVIAIKYEKLKMAAYILRSIYWAIGIIAIIFALAALISFVWCADLFTVVSTGVILLLVVFFILSIIFECN